MDLFGSTRSVVERDHALICPDSFVRSPLPGWGNTPCVVLISPQMGARFMQFLAFMDSGINAQPPAAGIERVVYVIEGQIRIRVPGQAEHTLDQGGFAFLPAGMEYEIESPVLTKLNVFEKRFEPRPGQAFPPLVFGREQDVPGQPFMGNPKALLQTLLPDVPSFDLAVNRFRFQPGAALPLVEIHVMEHGLLMLEGQGIYRLGNRWYPVHAGDVIWMKSFCPQWFVAMGDTPASYLYYKDVNRDPLGANA